MVKEFSTVLVAQNAQDIERRIKVHGQGTQFKSSANGHCFFANNNYCNCLWPFTKLMVLSCLATTTIVSGCFLVGFFCWEDTQHDMGNTSCK